MNNISADATRVTAPPALHWACDSPALPLLAVVPPSRIEPFLFSVASLTVIFTCALQVWEVERPAEKPVE